MKNFILLFFCILLTFEAYATCPIETNNAVCTTNSLSADNFPNTVQSFDKRIEPTQFNKKLEPLTKTEPLNQMQKYDNSKRFDKGCQFGTCLDDLNKKNQMQSNE